MYVDKVEISKKQLMEAKKLTNELRPGQNESFVPVDDDHDRLLANLISQLETLRADDKLKQPEPSADTEELPSTTVRKATPKSENPNEMFNSSGSSEVDSDKIVKELKKLKRQNFITHCLLSVMIVLTVAWQLSEVSLILKVKDGMNHPFRSLGNIFSGIVKGPNSVNGEEGEKQSTNQTPIESSSLPGLKIPELPLMEMPDLDFNGNPE
ncbi:hypothetical protein LguiA_032879 [Lonicera macranthoides]